VSQPLLDALAAASAQDTAAVTELAAAIAEIAALLDDVMKEVARIGARVRRLEAGAGADPLEAYLGRGPSSYSEE